MRGRANNPAVQRAKARRHAERAHHCSCGKIVRGNGGKAGHEAMHERRGDWRLRGEISTWRQANDQPGTKHTWISLKDYQAKFPDAS